MKLLNDQQQEEVQRLLELASEDPNSSLTRELKYWASWMKPKRKKKEKTETA